MENHEKEKALNDPPNVARESGNTIVNSGLLCLIGKWENRYTISYGG